MHFVEAFRKFILFLFASIQSKQCSGIKNENKRGTSSWNIYSFNINMYRIIFLWEFSVPCALFNHKRHPRKWEFIFITCTIFKCSNVRCSVHQNSVHSVTERLHFYKFSDFSLRRIVNFKNYVKCNSMTTDKLEFL